MAQRPTEASQNAIAPLGRGWHAGHATGPPLQTSFSKLPSLRTEISSPIWQLSQQPVPLRTLHSSLALHAVTALVRKSSTTHWPCTQSGTKYFAVPCSPAGSPGQGAQAMGAGSPAL